MGSNSNFRGGPRKTHVLWNIVHNSPSRSYKVVDFGTNRKGVCDILLVINSNFGPVLHRFWDTASYWLKIVNFSYPTLVSRPRVFRGTRQNFWKLITQKLDGWGYCMVKIAWSITSAVLHESPVWQTDRRRDRQTYGRNCDSIARLQHTCCRAQKLSSVLMLTVSEAPSGGDAFGTSNNGCTRQTDRPDVLIERQWGRQFNHGNVPVVVRQVLLMFHAWDPSKLLHLRLVIFLKHFFSGWHSQQRNKRQHENIIPPTHLSDERRH